MNITELARILRISPQELRNALPKLGFDIGQKAIKINKNDASRIIKEWPNLRRKLQIQAEIEAKEIEAKEKEERMQNKKTVEISGQITVREFADLSEIPINKVLAELMKNGIFVSLNEKIDYDTAWLMGNELGADVVRADNDSESGDSTGEDKLKKVLDGEDKCEMHDRSPVVVIMGHVDHGKTKLLDTIRETNVIDGEAGGITQHIGAYQVERKNKTITFIDTPGHEAFTAMRSRGAKVADIAILIVAADDGVKPQTVEAFRIIEKAKIPFMVAINKIDKPEANIDKTKQELSSQLNITPEDWGGKTVFAPISAKQGLHIDELLDVLLLIADMEKENIQANPCADAIGTIIESHIDKGAGPVATMLIQNGTLKIGDNLVFNNINYGKARALYDHGGKKIKEAGPSVPVKLIGLRVLPEVGDMLEVGDGKRIKTKKIKSSSQPTTTQSSEPDNDETEKLNVIIKSDVLGSAEAIEESLIKIGTAKVKVKIIHKGLGNISEGDIKKATASNALILAFNVKTPAVIEELAREEKISIKEYSVIYHLINDIKEEMQGLVKSEIERVDLGKMKVLKIFRTENKSQILGGKITNGKIVANCLIEVVQNGEIIERGKIVKLQSGKQDVNDVEAGEECGIQFEGRPVIEEGDILNIYEEKETTESIN